MLTARLRLYWTTVRAYAPPTWETMCSRHWAGGTHRRFFRAAAARFAIQQGIGCAVLRDRSHWRATVLEGQARCSGWFAGCLSARKIVADYRYAMTCSTRCSDACSASLPRCGCACCAQLILL